MATFRKLPSGSWQARVRRKGESTLTSTFNTKALAEQWARSIETQIDRGTYVDRSEAESTHVGELIDRYLSEVSPSKKCYAQEVRRLSFLKRGLGHLVVASIQSKHIAAYREKRLNEGKPAAAVIRELGNLSHVFKVAIKDWGYPLLANPAKLIRKPSPARGRNRRLGGEELAMLLGALKGTHEVSILVQLAIETGMRRSELLSLSWENMNLVLDMFYFQTPRTESLGQSHYNQKSWLSLAVSIGYQKERYSAVSRIRFLRHSAEHVREQTSVILDFTT